MANILVVDDEASMRITLAALLRRKGLKVATASTASEAACRLANEAFEVVITDLRLGADNGMDVVRAARSASPPAEVLVMTAYASVESAVEALKLGAFDYIRKPFEPPDIVHAVDQALEHRSLLSEVTSLRAAVGRSVSFDSIVAESPAMQQVLDLVARVAPTDATVLIQGESGTGKELVARALHANSPRRQQPFVALNCGALPEPLLESELFGHARGAFTGAVEAKKGLFEEADRGTLFLDEISETSPATQVKLLRALQDGEIRRVGSNTSVRTDVRIIAATNQNLASLVASGRFREDLYYRLQVLPIEIPPLRERPEDILPLAEHFIRLYSRRYGRSITGLTHSARNALLAHSWLGNVRELENAIERAVILASGDQISARDLVLSASTPTRPPDRQPVLPLHEAEKRHILHVLELCGYNRAAAAKALGIGRNTLWRKLRSFGIK
ncbi:MAG: sigma-54-dependent transcriptional regulator [Armatimonadota bacterium]